MVNKDKGESKKAINSKKKQKVNTSRRPTGVVTADEPPQVNIPPRASLSATRSAHQSQDASTRVAPHSGYSISVPNVAPRSTISLGGASQCSSFNTTSGSVGLSSLRLGSNGSEPSTPTTQHSDAQRPQPGDRDSTQRLIIEPVGYRIRPDEGLASVILKCIGAHYNGVYPSWSVIPINTQG